MYSQRITLILLAQSFKFEKKLFTPATKLIYIAIDDQLNFESHISEICRKAAGQLNALKRLGFYIPLESRKILANSFILSNFNYCPLVWYFSTAKQVQKIEKIQERVLRFVHNDYETDYPSLLKNNKSVTMEVKRMRYLSIEIYKTLHYLNPQYMKQLFQLNESKYSSRRPLDLIVPRVNQTSHQNLGGSQLQLQFLQMFLLIKFLAVSSPCWIL